MIEKPASQFDLFPYPYQVESLSGDFGIAHFPMNNILNMIKNNVSPHSMVCDSHRINLSHDLNLNC